MPTQRERLIILFLGVLLPLIGFGVLAELTRGQRTLFWDIPLLLWVHRYASPTLDIVMTLVARLGYTGGVIPVDGLILVLLAAWSQWGNLRFFALAVGGAQIIDWVAKLIFHRVRPALWVSPAPEHSFSFPSGHAVASMAFVAALSVLLWPTRWRWPILILGGLFVVLVGLSRVYLGVHYPSDVVAGWATALAWVSGLSIVLYGRPVKPTPSATPAI
jgi:undecaprenyl-diphosphatase